MFGNVREHIFGMTTIWLISEVTNLRFERFADCECEIKCLVISVLVGWLGLRLIFRQMNRSSVQKMSATSDTTARATDNNGQCLHPVFAVSYPQSRQDARLTQSDSSEQSSSWNQAKRFQCIGCLSKAPKPSWYGMWTSTQGFISSWQPQNCQPSSKNPDH